MSDSAVFEINKLFDALSSEEVELIMKKFDKMSFTSGDYVFREYEAGESLYIVNKGSVSLNKQITGDVDKTLFIAGEGAVFGEFSFMDGRERSASAHVEEDAEIMALERTEFDKFRQENPQIGMKIYGNLLNILIERLRRMNDTYRDAVRWALDITGTQKLNFHHLITESMDIRLDLVSNKSIEGKIIQLETTDAGHEIIMADKSGRLAIVPYHAITMITVA
ncbi:MAG: cyclic nucleotide-binding domain-containing protein [Desulfobacterales bacterium]|nr:cyclic nucleotide-binding domain-containing protein [Desulfobacterales bacterium]